MRINRILIVIPNEQLASILCVVLRSKEGISPTIAHSSLGAVAALRQGEFRAAVVLESDAQMIAFLASREIPAVPFRPLGPICDLVERLRKACVRKRGPKFQNKTSTPVNNSVAA